MTLGNIFGRNLLLHLVFRLAQLIDRASLIAIIGCCVLHLLISSAKSATTVGFIICFFTMMTGIATQLMCVVIHRFGKRLQW